MPLVERIIDAELPSEDSMLGVAYSCIDNVIYSRGLGDDDSYIEKQIHMFLRNTARECSPIPGKQTVIHRRQMSAPFHFG